MLRPYQMVSILMLVAAPALADEVVNCFTTAAAAEATARERDSGTPQVDAAHEVSAFLSVAHQSSMTPEALDNMVSVIYNAPEVTRQQVYSRVLEQCIALTTPH